MRFLDDAKTNIAILLTKERLLHSQVNRGGCKVMLGRSQGQSRGCSPFPSGETQGAEGKRALVGALWVTLGRQAESQGAPTAV